MFQDRKEELERLEAALLEQEETQEEAQEENVMTAETIVLPEFEEEPEAPEEAEEEALFQETPAYTAYSNQPCDVDFQEYTTTVEEGSQNKGLGFLTGLFVVLTVLLCVCIWMFLRVGGFLG